MKTGICFILLLTLTAKGIAQDPLFSQQYLLPTLINPAAAGNESNYRAGFNYRNQWGAVARPFNTITAVFDTRFGANKKSTDNHGLSAGMFFLRDKAGDPELSTIVVEAQVAYRVKLNANSTFSGGLAAGLDQRTVNPADGKWGSQFDGVFYDPGIASGESYASNSETHIDLGAGVIYELRRKSKSRRKKQDFTFEAGVSAYHLGRMALSESQLMTQEIGIRVTGFTTAHIGLNEMMAIIPCVFAHRQSGSIAFIGGAYFKQTLVTGTSFVKDLKESYLMVGAFYDPSRAIIAKGILLWGNYSLGLAYDIDISDVADFGSSARAFELSLIYQWNKKK